jgi:hypothetical protein
MIRVLASGGFRLPPEEANLLLLAIRQMSADGNYGVWIACAAI